MCILQLKISQDYIFKCEENNIVVFINITNHIFILEDKTMSEKHDCCCSSQQEKEKKANNCGCKHRKSNKAQNIKENY